MLFEPAYNRRILASQAFWLAVWAGVSAVGALLRPDPAGHGTHQQLGLPPCPSVILFNKPCPACGLTTSWTALLHGDLLGSFRDHPLGPAMYLAFTAWAWAAAYGTVRGLRFRTDARWAGRTALAFLVVFLAFGAYRVAVTPTFQTTREAAFASTVNR